MYGKQIYRLSLLTLSLVVFSGCPESGRNEDSKLPSFPVTGKILLNDAEPALPIFIILNPTLEAGADPREATRIRSGEGGVFTGKAPAGKYKATFLMRMRNKSIKTQDVSHVDLLEGEYSDIAASKFDVEVKEVTGEEVNSLGDFKLEGEVELPDNVKEMIKLKEKVGK